MADHRLRRCPGQSITKIFRGNGITCEAGLLLLPEEFWLDFSQISGKIFNSEKKDISITVTSYGENRDAANRYYNISIHYIYNKIQSSEEIFSFLRKCLDIFNMGSFVEFNQTISGPRFTILKRHMSDIFLEGINTVTGKNDSGTAYPQLAFSMKNKTHLRDSLSKVLACFSNSEIRWHTSKIEIEKGHWKDARPWLEAHHQGPWEHCHYHVPYHDWNPDLFLQEAKECEVIPVGVFDFTRAKKSNADPPLRGQRIFVDLFREGDNWHFTMLKI